MRLSDLVDLEWQLAEDDLAQEAGQGHAVLERDSRLGPRIFEELGVSTEEARARLDSDPKLQGRVCTAFVERLRRAGLEFYGERLESGYRVVGLLLAFFGFLLGVGTARAVLSYSGKEPINVFNFLAVFVLLQLLLLVLMIVLFTGRRVILRDVSFGWFQALIMRLARTRFVDRLLAKRSKLPFAEALTRLRSRNTLFKDVERWLLFALTQRFGVAFNLGALATAVLLVTFTDLAFGWSTTLNVGPSTVHEACDVVALPWSAWQEVGVPSLELVTETQWSRLQGGGFVSGLRPEEASALARGWWPFLIMGLVIYGLLPRLLALIFGFVQGAKALRRVPLDHFRCQRLYERLLPPILQRATPNSVVESPSALSPRAKTQPSAVAAEGGKQPNLDNSPQSHESDRAGKTKTSEKPPRTKKEATFAKPKLVLIIWGALAKEGQHLRELLAPPPKDAILVVDAGLADPANDALGLATIQSNRPECVHFVVEAGVQPTREILTYLRDLRAAMGARCGLKVSVLSRAKAGFQDAEPDELSIWRRRLEGEGDPYLGLHCMRDAS